MSLIRIEGFEFLPSGTQEAIAGAKHLFRYGDYMGSSTATRFDYGQSINLGTGTTFGGIRGWIIPNNQLMSVGIAGAAFYRNQSNEDTQMFIGFFDAVYNAPQLSVSLDRYGIIRVWRGWPGIGGSGTQSPGPMIGATAIDAYQNYRWCYLEVKVIVHDVNGEVEVRLNTKTVLHLINVDTKALASTTFDSVLLAGHKSIGTGIYGYVDDYYLCDDQGTINNGFLGNVRVKTQQVVSDTAQQDLLIGGSSPPVDNFEAANDLNLTEVAYVYTDTPGNYDLYGLDPIIDSPLVHGVQMSSAMRIDDATQRIGRNVLSHGGVEVEGEDKYVNQDFTYYRDIVELNPSTGSKFTGTELNAALLGPKMQA